MLILSRKLGESIVIDGRITVKVVRLDGETVKLGIEAPAEVPVHRQEVYDEIQRNNQEALTNNGHTLLPRLVVKKTDAPIAADASAVATSKPKIIPPTRR